VKRGLLVVTLVLVAVGLAVGLPRLERRVYVGTGFVAKQMCSCMFVGDRSFDACRPDMFREMDRVAAEVLPADDGVRAWVPLLGERTARYVPGEGCTLLP